MNELFSTLPNYVDYIDVHTLYNGSEFVEKVYLEVVDTYHINRYVESGKSFVKGYNNFVRFYTVDFDVTDAQDENKCFVESLLNIDLFKREEKNISNLNEVVKYGSATTSLDFDAGEVYFSDIEDGVYGKIEGITLYDLKKDEYIGNKDNASAKIFNNFAKNIVKEIPSFKDVFEEYADGFEDCRFRVEVDYEEYGVFVGIVFISSEDDFCELVYDELEDTKEFLVNSYNGELSFEVRI